MYTQYKFLLNTKKVNTQNFTINIKTKIMHFFLFHPYHYYINIINYLYYFYSIYKHKNIYLYHLLSYTLMYKIMLCISFYINIIMNSIYVYKSTFKLEPFFVNDKVSWRMLGEFSSILPIVPSLAIVLVCFIY
jgi:hypothetical protein